MQIRRVLALWVAVFFAVGSLTFAQNAQKDDKKRNKQEQQDIEALVKLVDGVSMGQQQPPTDLTVTWDSNHFVKGQDGKTYVPFTVQIDRSKLATPGVAMYIRAIAKNGSAATTPTGTAGEKKDEDKKKDEKVEYPWDNIHFVEVPADGKISRAMAVPGGGGGGWVGGKG
jgi:hypothetical protein